MPENRSRIADALRSPCHPPSSFPAVSTFAARTSAGFHPHRHATLAALGLAIVVTLGCNEVCAEPATARPVNTAAARGPFAAFVAEASQRFGIPAAWIRAVMRAESFSDVRAISPKGAIGLMQIMPETWAALRQRYRLGADPYDAHDNIIAGVGYLRELHDRYGISGFLAAYNAGPARWEEHLTTGRPLPAETRAYLSRLAPIVGGGSADDTVILAAVVKSWTEASLFPTRPARPPNDMSSASPPLSPQPSTNHPAQDWTGLAPQSDGLFVALSNRERSQ
ncbi:MAG: lytic transglycosylase domain-containing protein [Hyphomicrobium sp.]|uniref:lytic transglycosylase domain-containing protein n=1 Tax=Hyphomicrobium sp. TaxID=82 RepID=UPI003561FB23